MVLKTTGVIVTILAAIALVACGGSNDPAKRPYAKTSAPITPAMSSCIDRWNKAVTKTGMVAKPDPGDKAMVFVFKGSECGVALLSPGQCDAPDCGPLGIYIDRGNGFEMFLSSDGGFAETVDDSVLQGAQEISSQAGSGVNATANADGTLIADPGATMPTFDVSGAPGIVAIVAEDGVMARRQNYALNRPDWEALTMKDKVDAITQFWVDSEGRCTKKSLRPVAEALRDGTFDVTRDGVQITLRVSCAYFETGGEPVRDLPEDSRDCPRFQTSTGLASVTVQEGSPTCVEATGIAKRFFAKVDAKATLDEGGGSGRSWRVSDGVFVWDCEPSDNGDSGSCSRGKQLPEAFFTER